MTVSLRRDLYLRRFIPDFIRLVAPKWSYDAIRREMAAEVRHVATKSGKD
jgi:hypothetical protein